MHSGPEAVVNDLHHSHYTKISIGAQNYFLRQQENVVTVSDSWYHFSYGTVTTCPQNNTALIGRSKDTNGQ